MLAPNPTHDKQLTVGPADNFEIGQWIQVTLPVPYHVAMQQALAWKRSGYTTMVSEKSDGWRAYVSAWVVSK